MKRKIIFWLAVFAACSLKVADAQVFSNSELQVSAIADKVWMIETAEHNTMYLVEGNKKALLIDTGNPCQNFAEVLSRITTKPVLVVLTHGHGDHTGNIESFGEIYMHAADTVLLDKSYRGKVHYIGEGYVFNLGGRKISVRHMPAHTPGSIVLTDKRTGNCFSGDAFGSGQVWLQLRPIAPVQTYISSLKKMMQLMSAEGVTKIYCGHYYYPHKPLGKAYLEDMLRLAEALADGTAANPQPYPVKASIGCDNPMIVTQGEAGIVYDPERIR